LRYCFNVLTFHSALPCFTLYFYASPTVFAHAVGSRFVLIFRQTRESCTVTVNTGLWTFVAEPVFIVTYTLSGRHFKKHVPNYGWALLSVGHRCMDDLHSCKRWRNSLDGGSQMVERAGLPCIDLHRFRLLWQRIDLFACGRLSSYNRRFPTVFRFLRVARRPIEPPYDHYDWGITRERAAGRQAPWS